MSRTHPAEANLVLLVGLGPGAVGVARAARAVAAVAGHAAGGGGSRRGRREHRGGRGDGDVLQGGADVPADTPPRIKDAILLEVYVDFGLHELGGFQKIVEPIGLINF